MRAHLNDWAGSVAERTTRRRAAAVLGGLALGALRLVGMGHRADAKNNNSCQQCKKKCRRNNQKPGKKNKTNCSKKCNDKCKNN